MALDQLDGQAGFTYTTTTYYDELVFSEELQGRRRHRMSANRPNWHGSDHASTRSWRSRETAPDRDSELTLEAMTALLCESWETSKAVLGWGAGGEGRPARLAKGPLEL